MGQSFRLGKVKNSGEDDGEEVHASVNGLSATELLITYG